MLKNSHFKVLFILLISAIVVITAIFALNRYWNHTETTTQSETQTSSSSEILYDTEQEPNVKTSVVLDQLKNPWDIAFFEDNSFIFTQRHNKLTYFANNQLQQLPAPSDTYVRGEGGLMSVAIDPAFKQNNHIYLCFNSNSDRVIDVKVVRFEFNRNNFQLTNRNNIVTDIPANISGRHSGCRLEFGKEDYLWVTTGDAAVAETPQSPTSLGGKILRITRGGQAAASNLAEPFDPRIYSYGHRNTQGIAFFPKDNNFAAPGISVEHGPDVDDEVNTLAKGNFGWDPGTGYDENVPMTDTSKFPEAVTSIWSTGRPTLALSGATIIQGEEWQAWNQAIATAALKTEQMIILQVNNNLEVKNITKVFQNEFGRLRTIAQSPAGDLYLLTDNGKEDKIVKVSVEK